YLFLREFSLQDPRGGSQSLRTFNQNYVPDAGRQNQSMIFIQMPASVTGEPFIARSANLQ
ncbi:hypothetical protein, partial [Escherichia coli]|uniref:hypothetical protein n=1 Tax=Escherichia coli TaxID=562 RepID=UPI0022DF35EA